MAIMVYRHAGEGIASARQVVDNKLDFWMTLLQMPVKDGWAPVLYATEEELTEFNAQAHPTCAVRVLPIACERCGRVDFCNAQRCAGAQ